MADYRVAIIGCGKPRGEDGRTGFATGHNHARGYVAAEGCTIVACADIVQENGDAFAKTYSIPNVYTDYNEMLAAEKPDIVSVCTWPELHAPMTIDCAKAGVKAVHCEKPMAPNPLDARKMVAACEKSGTQLTFNHQNRFDKRWNVANDLLKDGRIGKLVRMEGHWGNLFDVGTHWIDLFNMYNDETPTEWVLAQIDRSTDASAFGVNVETQAMVEMKYANGVYGLLFMGADESIGAEHRLLGKKGVIEVDWPVVLVRGKGGKKWEVLDGSPSEAPVTDGVLEIVDALRTGRESALSAKKAYAATEVIFAAYESSRRRGRVELPLDIDDNPLHSMIDAGQIGPSEA